MTTNFQKCKLTKLCITPCTKVAAEVEIKNINIFVFLPKYNFLNMSYEVFFNFFVE